MIFYAHHLGDYAEATAHLSFVEDAAYSRLIRKYYATEQPLPADIAVTMRLVGARSKEEKEAVATVLREFFECREDGWHQVRCDEEIARYHAAQPEREAKRAGEKERKRRSREHRARLFAELRDAGLTPQWDAPIRDLEADLSRLRSRAGHAPVTVTGHAAVVTGDADGTADIHYPHPHPHPHPLTMNQDINPLKLDDAREVFDHWRTIWGHPDSKLDVKRRARIEARLKTFSVAQLCEAISGFRNSDWHMGRDPKGGGKIYDKIETLLRDDSQVEEGMRLFANPPHPISKADLRLNANLTAADEFLRRTEPTNAAV